MTQNHTTRHLIVLFIGLFLLYCLTKGGDIFFPTFFIVSSIILMKNSKSVAKKEMLIGGTLGILSLNPLYGFCSIFGYIGAKSFFNTAKHKIAVLPKSIKEFIIWGLIGTLILTSINTIWMLTDLPFNFSFRGYAIMMGLMAGIPEEILFKYFLYAFCIYLAGDKPFTKVQSVFVYLILIVPHVLLHYPSLSHITFFNFALMCGFGFSFAYIQRKSSLATAISVHFMVDFLRFTFFGV